MKLVKERGVRVAQATRDLDIHESTLRKWVREFGADPAQSFTGSGQMKPEQVEIERLRREVDHPGEYGPKSYFYEWEREWRHIGDLVFHQTEAAFLIIPEDSHSAARGFFDDAEYENTSPNYRWPFIEPCWTVEQVTAAFDDAQT